MMKRYIFVTLAALLLTGCASASQPSGLDAYAPANNLDTAPQKVVKPRALVVTPDAFLAKQHLSNVHIKTPKRLKGVEAIKAANKKALQQPDSAAYLNAIMTYDFVPGALYKIYCAPLNVTDIEFQDGEHIVSVAAGDTLRWQVSRTYSGGTTGRVEHLIIKPIDTDLKNSIVVTTDRHTYHLTLYSTTSTYMASVKWRYPSEEDGLSAVNDRAAALPYDATSAVNVDKLDFSYQATVTEGHTPDWMPQSVFNDGHKTYIQLPKNIQEAPTLFVGNDDQGDKAVNYRLIGNDYIIDRVVHDMQLRSGQDNPVVVQITYGENNDNEN